jgi:hypothetical protein
MERGSRFRSLKSSGASQNGATASGRTSANGAQSVPSKSDGTSEKVGLAGRERTGQHSKQGSSRTTGSAKGSDQMQQPASSSESFSYKQSQMEWVDIEPVQAADLEGFERRTVQQSREKAAPSSRRSSRTGTEYDNSTVADWKEPNSSIQAAVGRAPAECGEEFIVSPSPLAIALASGKGSPSGPASAAVDAASNHKGGIKLLHRGNFSLSSTRRARSLQEPSRFRRASDHELSSVQSADRREPPPYVSQKSVSLAAPLAPPLPALPFAGQILQQSHSSPETDAGPADRIATLVGPRFSKLITVAPELPVAQTGQAQAVAPKTTAVVDLQRAASLRGKIVLPAILEEWGASEDAKVVLVKILKVAGAQLGTAERGVVHFEADDEESLKEAQELLKVRGR